MGAEPAENGQHSWLSDGLAYAQGAQRKASTGTSGIPGLIRTDSKKERARPEGRPAASICGNLVDSGGSAFSQLLGERRPTNTIISRRSCHGRGGRWS